MSAFMWRGAVRAIVFFGLLIGGAAGAGHLIPAFDLPLLWQETGKALAGDLSGVSTPPFAFALAAGLVAVAGGLALAFLVLHVAAIGWSMGRLRALVLRTGGRRGFARRYEDTSARLGRDPLIGHAWREFDKALLPRSGEEDEIIRSTARPQAFINMAMAREQLFGLKMMGALPGYFVGIGLLLTFIGLVLALHKAAAGVSTPDTALMQNATRELLQVATFKFATSIAGLGSSIALSFLFRIYTIAMERAFARFCEVVERRVRYVSPQEIADETRLLARQQLELLTEIGHGDFLSRMARELALRLAPAFEGALDKVLAPATRSMGEAVHSLADQNQAGMSQMLDRFSDSVQRSAGTELAQLAATLNETQVALVRVQEGLAGTGADFGRRMAEAADNLNRLVSEGGARLTEGSDHTRAALMEAVAALRETFDAANRRIDEGLGNAAGGASARLEEAMGRVLAALEAQVGDFRAALGGFQTNMAGQLDETRARVGAAQAEATEAVAQASAEAARALRDGLGEAMSRINGEMARFAAAMKASEVTMVAQAQAVRAAADSSQQVAAAFDQTAREVRTAAQPLAQSGTHIAAATEKLAEAVARSVSALDAGQDEARRLAQALTGHVAALDQLWRNYQARFEGVDETLSRTFETLAQGTGAQHERLALFMRDVDENFARAVETLAACIDLLSENTEGIGHAVIDLRQALHAEAAE